MKRNSGAADTGEKGEWKCLCSEDTVKELVHIIVSNEFARGIHGVEGYSWMGGVFMEGRGIHGGEGYSWGIQRGEGYSWRGECSWLTGGICFSPL